MSCLCDLLIRLNFLSSDSKRTDELRISSVVVCAISCVSPLTLSCSLNWLQLHSV